MRPAPNRAAMPDSLPLVSPDLKLCERCPPCIHAAFQDSEANPLLARCNSDEHGELAVFVFRDTAPCLIEIIHSRPHVIHGNHRHRRSTEMLTVVSGVANMYLLCGCSARHVFERRMKGSDSIYLPPGTAHAFHALSDLVVSSIFIGNDPRLDRERVDLIAF